MGGQVGCRSPRPDPIIDRMRAHANGPPLDAVRSVLSSGNRVQVNGVIRGRAEFELRP